MYASAQSLDFLAMTKNCSFPNGKQLASHPEFPDEKLIIGAIGRFAPNVPLQPALKNGTHIRYVSACYYLFLRGAGIKDYS
jgi:hypothetical protein